MRSLIVFISAIFSNTLAFTIANQDAIVRYSAIAASTIAVIIGGLHIYDWIKKKLK